MIHRFALVAIISLLGMSSMVANENQASIVFSSVNIKGQRFYVVDENDKALSDALIFHVNYPTPLFDPKHALDIAKIIGLPQSVEALVSAIKDEVYRNIEEFELFQSNSIGQFSLLAPAYSGASENGIFEIKTPKTLANPSTNLISGSSYRYGAFWIVFKPGFHPGVIFEDWSDAKSGNWIEHRVRLIKWPDRNKILVNRPYVFANIQLQKEIKQHWSSRNPGHKPIFGKDPFLIWEERLLEFQKDALAKNNKLDAAWLELAIGLSAYRTPNGFSKDGGIDDYINGRIWKALDRMINLCPTNKIWLAFYESRRFVLNSPMGLNQMGFDFERNKKFNNQVSWSEDGLDMFLAMLDNVGDLPLLAIKIGNMANCNGFWKSEKKIRDRFFENRVLLMARLLNKYPSALWFESVEAMCKESSARNGYCYHLEYASAFKNKVKN